MQFSVKSKLDIQIRVSKEYWKIITEIKHPAIAKYDTEIKETLRAPDEIRKSRIDPDIFLYYKKVAEKYICVVARHEDKQGFVITAYITNKIKEGELVWKK